MSGTGISRMKNYQDCPIENWVKVSSITKIRISTMNSYRNDEIIIVQKCFIKLILKSIYTL